MSRKFGTASLIIAVFSCLGLVSVWHIGRLGVLFGGKLLALVEWLGLVTSNPYAVLKSSSVFSLNDANAVLWFTWFAVAMALTAVALALWAEFRGESSANSAAGFTVALLGIGIFHPPSGLVGGLLGLAALSVVRRRRDASAI
ncbi:hypothetical protein [Ramlibacter humi]|uniref:Uncharacterized protein n=1 Tax=Ramlibacter humi TaxID=2530451 RepID=A0A4Z0CBW5_9BURK|nr:hypothetical protein [Ramlibacter humi]TFZ07655.1 hypothetical protein EZ216_00360 [Ramlibacter humi]